MPGPEQSFPLGERYSRRTTEIQPAVTSADVFSVRQGCPIPTTWAEETQTLVAQGKLNALALVNEAPQAQTTGYKDETGMWHFASSDNDLAGGLKEWGWNREWAFWHRANPDRYYDKAAAQLCVSVFPNVREYADKFDAPRVIEAIARNEQMYYDPSDAIEDAFVRLTNCKDLDLSIGPEQMKIHNISSLVQKYPDVFGDPQQFPSKALDRFTATLLIGAYLDDRIATLKAWTTKAPARSKLSIDDRLLYDHSFPLWQQGKYVDALMSSYNPGDKFHLQNVQRHLNFLENAP